MPDFGIFDPAAACLATIIFGKAFHLPPGEGSRQVSVAVRGSKPFLCYWNEMVAAKGFPDLKIFNSFGAYAFLAD